MLKCEHDTMYNLICGSENTTTQLCYKHTEIKKRNEEEQNVV